MSLSQETKDLLIRLADQYEKKDFIKDDPIWFPRRLHDSESEIEDIEISAIISSWLAYGSRSQFVPKLQMLHELMEWKPYEYIMSGEYKRFRYDESTLYRFCKMLDFFRLCDNLRIYYSDIYPGLSIGEALQKSDPLLSLIRMFDNITAFPKNDNSACKRLNMLLRWMVRKNSPVDLGLWDIDPTKLIIPVDTHVHRMALELGLTQRKQADMWTALEITDAMREIWPDDPAKGDFALFGYGVNHK